MFNAPVFWRALGQSAQAVAKSLPGFIYKHRGALRGTPGSVCPHSEPNATELPSCAPISARAAQRWRRRRWWWRGEESARRPGPEGQVFRRVLWYVLRYVLRRVLRVFSLHVLPKGRQGGGARIRVAARRSIPF